MRSIDKGMNWTKASTKTPIYDLNFIVKKSNNVMKYFIGILFFVNTFSIAVAQNLENDPNALDYVSSKTYTLAGIKVEGTEFYDANVIRSLTGLIVGQEIEIPGEAVSRAIRKLWDNNLFANISFEIEEIRGNEIFLLLKITEKPRLSELVINGIKGSDKDDILEKLENLKRRPVTEGLKISINNTIEDFFFEKGFLKANYCNY
jgi:outer membrane protein insertion porin family